MHCSAINLMQGASNTCCAADAVRPALRHSCANKPAGHYKGRAIETSLDPRDIASRDCTAGAWNHQCQGSARPSPLSVVPMSRLVCLVVSLPVPHKANGVSVRRHPLLLDNLAGLLYPGCIGRFGHAGDLAMELRRRPDAIGKR
jgi:hypothetical protein